MLRNWRTAAAALGAATVGVLTVAAPAAADVQVTPSEAARGGPAELTFQVPEERAGAHTTKVQLLAPPATPIAEIYPLSVNGWAPRITTRKVDQPLEAIHGTRTTQVVSEITWTRVGAAPSKPLKPAQLKIALGPMPEADLVVFGLVQTYSDGTVVRWTDQPGAGPAKAKRPAPTVVLTGETAEGAHHGNAGGPANAAHSDVSAPRAEASDEGAYGILGAVLLTGVALGLGAGMVVFLRGRRGSAAAARAARRELLAKP
jgi:uncharacterized protein YcnI